MAPYLADLHIHSRYSRATSPQCNLEGLARWAQIKGVRVVGTGDCTHPAWFQELHEKLETSAPGLYRIRPEFAAPVNETVPGACRADVDFMITGEISSIYKRAGRTRKVHSLLFLPDIEQAAALNARLDRLGNIRSDGRPILGMDPRDLLSLLLEVAPDAFFAPAHIWTPWFSMLGSKSGFDSPLECFGELAEHVFAAETGLSSDPPMNWRVSRLDGLTLISNSDLHSPANLGRNANVFYGEPDFFAMREGLRNADPQRCGGTIDMFPEEGKYHLDGHRKCGVCLRPEQSLALDNLCPVCAQPLVLGVLHRVVELADRPEGFKPTSALPCRHIIPLPEILGEMLGCGSGARKVAAVYDRLVSKYGPEMRILLETPVDELEGESPPLLAEAMRRLRREQVIRRSGYDGEYGEIRVFDDGEKEELLKQGVFLSAPEPSPLRRKRTPKGRPEASAAAREHSMMVAEAAAAPLFAERKDVAQADGSAQKWLAGLTENQMQAVQAGPEALLIVAGPGAGKTRTLTARLAALIRQQGVAPERVLAVTFTNRATQELQRRLNVLLPELKAGAPKVCTFHGLALEILRRHAKAAGLAPNFTLIDQEEELSVFRRVSGMSAREASKVLKQAAMRRQRMEPCSELPGFAGHLETLAGNEQLPLDEIVPCAVRLLQSRPELRPEFDRMGVDEFQDINLAQYEMVKLLAPQGRGLCVIGDPDQAIYGFRGSDVRYFLQFKDDFPDAVTVGLRENFRSSGIIVEASSQIMASGRTSLSLATEAVAGSGVQVRMHAAASETAEAEFIAREIEHWLGGTSQFSMDSGLVGRASESGGVSLGDVAILTRLRATMPPLLEALANLGLPAQAAGDASLIEKQGAREFVAAFQACLEGAPHESTGALLKLLEQRKDLSLDARERLKECAGLACAGLQPQAFLDSLMLRQGADEYDEKVEKIAVLTMHAAKGLEFPIVFIAGCEEGLIPYEAEGRESDPAEERRLFYVAMTRAQRVLYLTRAGSRRMFGRSFSPQPSPYLSDISQTLKQDIRRASTRRSKKDNQLKFRFE